MGRLARDGRLLLRILVVWCVTAGMAILLARALPGFQVDSTTDAFGAAAAVAVVNAIVWPVFMQLVLGVVVYTFGLAIFVLNGVLVWLVMEAVPGVTLAGAVTPVVVGVVLTATTALVSGLLSIDDDRFYQRFIVSRTAMRARRAADPDVPGVLFLQIDGLGYDVVRRAVRDGDTPVLAGWLRRGSHRLAAWETDWTSQTGASQAGILFGHNEDMPAFRWFEKETGRLLVSNRASSAAEIERRHSDGRGLLHNNGASRGNLFSGDAAEASLTLSVAVRRKGRLGAGYYGYFANPYNAIRTFFAFFAEVGREIAQSTSQRRLGIRPRVPRGGIYPVLRAFSTIVSRDVTVQAILEDLMAGRSVIYANFTGYDEVAHHSGIERYDALAVLRGVDRQIGRLAAATRLAPRPYRIVVLADHGQSQGESFLDRYGETLAEVVDRACQLPPPAVREKGAGAEARGLAGAPIARAASRDTPVAHALRRAARSHVVGGELLLGEAATREAADQVSAGGAVLTLASGNLGLVYLTDHPGRVSLEALTRTYPRLVPALVEHPGVGFVLVRSDADGPIVLGQGGVHYLATGRVDGPDPLRDFGPDAARRVLRTDSFAHTGDLMVNSSYDPQTDQITAFERFVGSHGGMGGSQTRAFLLHPTELADPAETPFGAEAVHDVLRGWLRDLGHDGYADPAAESKPGMDAEVAVARTAVSRP